MSHCCGGHLLGGFSFHEPAKNSRDIMDDLRNDQDTISHLAEWDRLRYLYLSTDKSDQNAAPAISWTELSR